MYKRSGIGIIDYEDGDLRGNVWYILLSLRIGGAWIETVKKNVKEDREPVAPYRRSVD